MANPTTNYSFAMPTNVDLVKDLPADFEIFGQAVDTQMKTNADAAIAKTIVDAKGDIIAATAADTVSKLSVGANDTVLTADSSTATGLKWAAAASGGMTLLSTTTLSGATTTISSIDGTYKDLQIIISGITINTSAEAVTVRPNAANISSYGFQVNATNDSGTNEIKLSGNKNIPTTSAENAFAMTIFNYASSTYYKTFTWAGRTFDTVAWGIFGGGGLTTTSPITSFEIACGGGRTFSGGQVLIYGVK